MNSTLGKILYALVFCLFLPLGLWAWTIALEAKRLPLPALRAPLAGGILAAAGFGLMLWAMSNLWTKGGGLPMNGYPPPRFVASGAYALVPHPIYFGFGLLVPGLMLATGTAAGLWIVSPVLWLAMTALVVGYERLDLLRRFGSSLPSCWLRLPPDAEEPPSLSQRASALVLAFVPWLVLYQVCALFAPGQTAVDTRMPFERTWPVWEWTGFFYLGAYGWVALAPFVASTSAALRRFVGTALLGTGFVIWCYLAFPFVALPRALDQSSLAGQALAFERSLDTPACACPSFHVFWAFAAAELWFARCGRFASLAIAAAIALSCVTVGAHSLADLLAGWLVWLGASRRREVWSFLRNRAESVANYWKDWRIGGLRILNHGGYVALATLLGLWLTGLLLGPGSAKSVVLVAACGVVGAGLWGQWLEASSQLSRPFGYFGGLFGSTVGVCAAALLFGDAWPLLAAFAVAAPLIQGIGRLRCLVQGCCHGRPTDDAWLGIRHTQPLSRVCRIAGWSGRPLHPTALYSMLGNVLVFGLLLRLWLEGADASLIAGLYLILSTCARFMEEAYRGEPQTLRYAGLAIYQWLALACLLAGIVLTSLPSAEIPAWTGWSALPLFYALPFAVLVWFCMGVDFPDSNRRLSRLA